jgi:hypothetical protein
MMEKIVIYDSKNDDEEFEERYTLDCIEFKSKNSWNIEIIVNDVEGDNVSHFHIENKSKNFYCAVCLHTNKYFKHNKYQDELSSHERKKLVNILTLEHPILGITYYEVLCFNWNQHLKNISLKVDSKIIPDYKNMKESIH